MVHGVTDLSQYDLQAKCTKVNKNKPVRPSFAPVTSDELVDAFTHGLAERNGCVVNALHKRMNGAEACAGTASSRKRSRRKRKRSQERVAQAEPSQSHGDQRPTEK